MRPELFTAWKAVAKTVNACTKLVMDGEVQEEAGEDDEGSGEVEGSEDDEGSWEVEEVIGGRVTRSKSVRCSLDMTWIRIEH